MTFNKGQQAAYNGFTKFADNPDATMFALFGAAGTGKSFTSGGLLEVMQPGGVDEFLWLAPTWKAVRIAGGFLADNGVHRPEIGYDAYFHQMGNMILTTTQQALGLRPVIEDDQTAEKVSFGKVGKGLIRKLSPKWIVIDEVSMLSWQNLGALHDAAKEVGTKILIFGDPNQLPPVNAQEIKWDKIPNRFQLTEIMRQSGDSAIPHFGQAIIDDEKWHGMTGTGLTHTKRAVSQFIDEATVPARNEADRDVFVGYRNSTVDRVQEAAAQKVYGHSATMFEPGEFVIAQSALHDRSGMVVANQDQLEVLSVDGIGRWGQYVRVRNTAGREVYTEYLSGAEMSDPSNPYRVELDSRAKRAQMLQKEWTSNRNDYNLNSERKAAWASFFELKDRTVLNFAHPFAITSHKSQGSTYRRTFIAAMELAEFSKRSLYVAATRPREELVY